MRGTQDSGTRVTLLGRLRHDPTDMLTRTVQPALWLLIFGEVFSRVRAIPTGKEDTR